MTAQKKEERSVQIFIDTTAKMSTDTNDVKNVGYGILKGLYKQLEIDKFWNWKTRNLSIKYSVDQIFRLLVFSRILASASKKGTFDDRGFYFEDFGDFSLDVIFVADRGLNPSDNIYYLNGDNKGEVNTRDGYVYGQSVRGADAEFKAWVLGGSYVTDKLVDNDGNEITFKHKSRIHPKELRVNVTKPGQKKKSRKTVSIDQKQMAYYSEKYAKKQKADREVMVQRAKDLIRYDGYYSIVTSELKMPDMEMREIYRGLIRIEDTFKISKRVRFKICIRMDQ